MEEAHASRRVVPDTSSWRRWCFWPDTAKHIMGPPAGAVIAGAQSYFPIRLAGWLSEVVALNRQPNAFLPKRIL